MNLRNRIRRIEEAASHIADAAATGEPACPHCGWPNLALTHAVVEPGQQLRLCPGCNRWMEPNGRPFTGDGATVEYGGRPGRVPRRMTDADLWAIDRICRRRGIELQPVGSEETP